MNLYRKIIAAVAKAGSPLLVCSGLFWIGAVVGQLVYGASWLFTLAWRISLVLVGCFWGSFLLHELAHALVICHIPAVKGVVVEQNMLRVSLRPQGALALREAVIISISGPGIPVLIGLLLIIFKVPIILCGIFISHLIFLLPCFGDGKALVMACRQSYRFCRECRDSNDK